MAAFIEGDHVKIKKLGITGQIIDVIKHDDGVITYLVESDVEGFQNGPEVLMPGNWPIYESFAADLESIPKN